MPVDSTETPVTAACDKGALCMMKGRGAQTKQLMFTEPLEGTGCSDDKLEAGAWTPAPGPPSRHHLFRVSIRNVGLRERRKLAHGHRVSKQLVKS